MFHVNHSVGYITHCLISPQVSEGLVRLYYTYISWIPWLILFLQFELFLNIHGSLWCRLLFIFFFANSSFDDNWFARSYTLPHALPTPSNGLMRIDVRQSSQIDFRLLSALTLRISLLRAPASRITVLRFWVVQIRAVRTAYRHTSLLCLYGC